MIGNPVSGELAKAYIGNRKKEIVTAGRLQPARMISMGHIHYFHKRFTPSAARSIRSAILAMEYSSRTFTAFSDIFFASSVSFARRHIDGFSGRVDMDIRESSMFVLSSNYEGVSNSMVEALALGLPVIATDCPVGTLFSNQLPQGYSWPENAHKHNPASGKAANNRSLPVPCGGSTNG